MIINIWYEWVIIILTLSVQNQMLSPLPKRSPFNMRSGQITSQGCMKNVCSTWSPGSCRDYQEKYFVFKRKLLEAMITMDPLSLLQSGIFEEYESSFNEHCCENKNQSASPTISQFESSIESFTNKINAYSMDGLTVTQVERRSRSCERISRQDRVIRNMQEQRNVEFVLFANLTNHLAPKNHSQQRQCYQDKQDDVREAQNILQLQQANQHFQRQQTQMVTKIQQLQTEKQQLQKQLRECLTKLQHQKAISITVTNQKTNKQLQFLLKEKQLIKKIQEYKQENQRLRAIQQNGQNTMLELNRPTETIRIIKEGNRMENLKEKVASEGRVRWALSKAWAAELNDECK